MWEREQERPPPASPKYAEFSRRPKSDRGGAEGRRLAPRSNSLARSDRPPIPRPEHRHPAVHSRPRPRRLARVPRE